MATSFTDCCIRYGQEYVYTTFSKGNMTLGEVYISLVYGLIDPSCLPAMAIIHYDKKIWCTNTRRLTLSKELERQGRFDLLKLMHVREVKENTAEYRSFVTCQLPALYRKGLDGLTVKVSDKRGATCCFDTASSRFRPDLEQHVVEDHLNGFSLELLKNLTMYYCKMCQTSTRIMCTKSRQRSFYTIVRKCGCQPKVPYRFARPWSQLTFAEMCHGLLEYNHTAQRNPAYRHRPPKCTEKSFQSIATQTTRIPISKESKSTETVVTTSSIDSHHRLLRRNDNGGQSYVFSDPTVEKKPKIESVVQTRTNPASRRERVQTCHCILM